MVEEQQESGYDEEAKDYTEPMLQYISDRLSAAELTLAGAAFLTALADMCHFH